MRPVTIPRLRPALDIFPSPSPEHPGFVIRDSFNYSDAILVIPPIGVLALPCLDGQHTEGDLQAYLKEQLSEREGDAVPPDWEMPLEAIRTFVQTLQSNGFLETEEFFALRERRHQEFRDSPVRLAAHAGQAYPDDAAGVRATMKRYFAGGVSGDGKLTGIAAPHVSPEGGWQSYAAAYRRLTPDLADRTFVILGTSHRGEPEKFGLTRKPYETPLGAASVNTRLLDSLVQHAPAAVVDEDYCHSFEHTIEFQVLFLQYMMGRPIQVLPILCGPFFDSLNTRRPPESQDSVRAFFDALGEMGAKHGNELFWVLGIDMAHIGARYGNDFEATANRGAMVEVAARDRARMERVCAGDAGGFLDLITPNSDDLNWCGYSALYTFMRAMPGARGRVLRYEQWNIDPQSVVSFAGMEFGSTDSGR
jgi:AmmeMemoRadiSam system protein B